MQSSSGGLFSLLANKILRENGVVFGARFDEKWDVIHDYTETMNGLAPFRKSKYVQSRIGNSFQKAEDFLKEGRKVLFTGTPCQINGLKLFLRKEYDNLLAADIACHGVPSPRVWNLFLREYVQDRPLTDISGIDFRDKSDGWENYRFTVTLNNKEQTIKLSEKAGENVFMKAFLENLILRPSCENCQAKCGPLGDLTIGDCWGVGQICPQFHDETGISIAIARNSKGRNALKNLDIEQATMILDDAKKYNGGLRYHVQSHPNRTKYFKKLDRAKSLRRYTLKALQPTGIAQIIRILKRFLP